MHVNKLVTVQTVKVLYKNHEFSVIPSGKISFSKMIEMCRYSRSIGDNAFIVDNEMYIDEGAFFNLSMKYCDEYLII